MKTKAFPLIVILVSFLLLFVFCGITDTSTNYDSVVIEDYLSLKVNNSWTYLKIRSGVPKDSIIQMVNVVENMDSIWYLNIKDSLFSRSTGNYQYVDTPEVTIYCDTCIGHSSSFICKHGTYDQFFRFDTNYSIVATGSLAIDGSTIQYIKKTIDEGFSMGWSGVYYVKNIGLVKEVYYNRGATMGTGTLKILKSFNGVDNKMFSCFDAAGFCTGIQEQCLQ